jgi:hypothetical protein
MRRRNIPQATQYHSEIAPIYCASHNWRFIWWWPWVLFCGLDFLAHLSQPDNHYNAHSKRNNRADDAGEWLALGFNGRR